jgi:hypothetical protein
MAYCGHLWCAVFDPIEERFVDQFRVQDINGNIVWLSYSPSVARIGTVRRGRPGDATQGSGDVVYELHCSTRAQVRTEICIM